MDDPTLYVVDLPRDRESLRGSPMTPTPFVPALRPSQPAANRLAYFIFPMIILALIGGSLYWLQWASHDGILLGYPMPTVHISPTIPSLQLTRSSIQFSVASNGRDLTYSWSFGDGTSGDGPSVAHAYQSNGTFTVTVTATDPTHQSSTDTTSVTIMPPRPTANFTYRVYSGSYSYPYVVFDASGSAADASTTITNYSWDFGDGNTDPNGSSQETHTYYSTGTYQVVLVVSDGVGQRSDVYTANVVI